MPTAITLDITLQIDREVAATPKVTSISGQTAQLRLIHSDESGVFIELTPTLRDGNQVHMDIVLAMTSATTMTPITPTANS